ncbi:MAG: hypothetical protein H6828_08285 [Planctomycetes bacterium]|nr:hypothetical protein [Planctomycetota bacterium]
MKSSTLLALVLAFLAAAFAAPVQQVLEKVPDVTFTRETEVDANGLQQFKPLSIECEACRGRGEWDCPVCKNSEAPRPDCVICGGDQKATCSACAGQKKVLDPLVELICPYCQGLAWYPCALCGGGGQIQEKNANGEKTLKPCGGCKSVGFFACTVCEGARKIPAVQVKKKPATEAKLKELQALREELHALDEALMPWEPANGWSKSFKSLEALLKKSGKALPPLKDMLPLLETVEKGQVKAGSGYQNFEENLDHQMRIFRNRSVYLVRHSVRVLDQCIARAEFNENAAAKK